MAYLQCLVCGKLSTESRCPKHRKALAARYGTTHQKTRKTAILTSPFCAHCRHQVTENGRCGDVSCTRCPIELHHVVPIQGGLVEGDSRRQLLCRICHRAVTKEAA